MLIKAEKKKVKRKWWVY